VHCDRSLPHQISSSWSEVCSSSLARRDVTSLPFERSDVAVIESLPALGLCLDAADPVHEFADLIGALRLDVDDDVGVVEHLDALLDRPFFPCGAAVSLRHGAP